MLPRVNRLTTKSDFQKVLKNKNFVHGKYFGVATLHEEVSKPAMVGVIVSNSVSKRATERNRIKRIARDVAYKHLTKFPEGIKIVVLAKKQANTILSLELREDLEKMFKRLK